MPGPGPRFFFIPAVAEAICAETSLESYHQRFAEAWQPFAGWAQSWLQLERSGGADAIEASWARTVAGGVPPQRAAVHTWG